MEEKVSLAILDIENLEKDLCVGKFFKKSKDLLEFAQKFTEFSRKKRGRKSTNTIDTVNNFKEKFVSPFLKDFRNEMTAAIMNHQMY